MKARAFLGKVRPDLENYQSDGVQARLTIGMCDDVGIPRNKDRFFLVTAKVDRQVQMGRGKQDRASPHPKCDAFNFAKGERGGKAIRGQASVRVLIQHQDIEDAYRIGCRCQQASGYPIAPGKRPLCQTWDGVTASRWDGQGFTDIQCLGSECPLRDEPPPDAKGQRQARPAKTQFKLIARLDEEDIPALLVSECTGSDINVANFVSLVETTTLQWEQFCQASGVSIPMNWFLIPIRMTVYAVTGDNTRSPRIDYTLDCDIREVFQRRVEWQQRMVGWGSALLATAQAPLQLKAADLITEDIDDLDSTEVLMQGDAASAQATTSAPTHEPVRTADQPAVEQPVQQPSTFEPTLYERCRRAKLSVKVYSELLALCFPAQGVADADAAGELLRKCLDRVAESPESLERIRPIWAPYADAIRDTAPELLDLLDQILPRTVAGDVEEFEA